MILKWISLFLSPSAASSINFLGRTTSHSWDKKSCCCNSCCWKNAIPAFTYPKSSSVTSCIIYALFYIYISNAFDIFKNRRTLSHRLIAAMFLSIFLICLSNFSCFFLSSWIFRLYIWPHVDFQIFGEKASNEPVKYIISLVFYTPEWLLVPVFLSVQASMTLSTAYSDDCFFNTVKSKRLPLKATSWTSFSPTTLSMELYIGNFSGQLTPKFKEDILFD